MAARLSLGVPLVGTQLRVSDDAFLLFYEKKKKRAASRQNSTFKSLERDAQERADGTDDKRQEDEAQDDSNLAMRQEV